MRYCPAKNSLLPYNLDCNKGYKSLGRTGLFSLTVLEFNLTKIHIGTNTKLNFFWKSNINNWLGFLQLQLIQQIEKL